MPYLQERPLKSEAGGPVPSLPKSFKGPPKLQKEKEAKAAQGNQAIKPEEEFLEDWVKKKWARYYEPNKMGHVKPDLDKMTFAQWEEYMKDALGQGKHRVTAASKHLVMCGQPVQEEQTKFAETQTALAGSRKRKSVAPAAEPQTVGVGTKNRPRKKPRLKAHITKEEYLKKH